MRCLTARLIAIGLLAAGFGLLAGHADACIRFDRAAEAHLIDRAIAAPATPAAQKAELKGLRQKMRASRGATSEQMVAYHNAVAQALKLLGRSGSWPRTSRREPRSPRQGARHERLRLIAGG